MKSISLIIISLAISSFCFAQTPSGSSSDGTSGSDTTNPDQENNSSGQYQNQNIDNGAGGNRSDYYEERKEPENVRYYSGSHRGTNIINDDSNTNRYREEEARNRMGESQFPDVVRIYSGSHYGNNIINKKEIDRTNSYYFGDPSSSYEGENSGR